MPIRATSSTFVTRPIDRQPRQQELHQFAPAIAPTDSSLEIRFEEILRRPSFEQRVLASLRPIISKLGVLSPHSFTELNRGVAGIVSRRADAETDPELQRKFSTLADLLATQEQDRRLLGDMRRALQKG